MNKSTTVLIVVLVVAMVVPGTVWGVYNSTKPSTSIKYDYTLTYEFNGAVYIKQLQQGDFYQDTGGCTCFKDNEGNWITLSSGTKWILKEHGKQEK